MSYTGDAQRPNGPTAQQQPAQPAQPDYRAAYNAQSGGWGASGPPQMPGEQQMSGGGGAAPAGQSFAQAPAPVQNLQSQWGQQQPQGQMHPLHQMLAHPYGQMLAQQAGWTPPAGGAPAQAPAPQPFTAPQAPPMQWGSSSSWTQPAAPAPAPPQYGAPASTGFQSGAVAQPKPQQSGGIPGLPPLPRY